MPEVEEFDKKADLYFARHTARTDLLRAEQAESEAARARQAANSSVQHYRDLLEALHGTLFDG